VIFGTMLLTCQPLKPQSFNMILRVCHFDHTTLANYVGNINHGLSVTRAGAEGREDTSGNF